ncbi:2-keto-4-carboxy-3-hexenedioate hydratase [Methylobacterium crusticola]|uniref:2-keto-4-carboxy-3-hexenedioate hydratase n=1 Tax=Methylobacterium crusticola TaxID=1697972 RepID=A0ABQ4R3Q6_9HYPH|nr:amidohydrolase family protein [Methylobacterium crusticola]GJD52094.1 2-keto-4-carboxy-3-hexenedioate hydratase [Methylobacterium crusticola]
MISASEPPGAPGCACCQPRRGFLRGLAGAGAAAALAARPGPAAAQPAPGARYAGLVIDCHGHYTTEPPAMLAWRKRQVDAVNDPAQSPSPSALKVSDDEVRASVADRQLKLQAERGISLALFSPRAGGMGHHVGNARTSLDWSIVSNDMIHRVATLAPRNFVGVCQLPQTPGVSPANCTAELARCVTELGFVGCNVNPDPSGGYWTDPPLSDRYWYPLWEKMVELDVPGMIHVSASANRNFQATGAHYMNGDTTAFMQFVTSDLFRDFPTLRLIIPHGGGAVPYHWGRYRGLAQDMKRPPLTELMRNVFFDTCVYHQAGIDLLLKVVPVDNVLFASEMVGAVNGIDPETGHAYDDTKRYVEAAAVSDADRAKLYAGNAGRVYPRLAARLSAAGVSP